MSATIHRSVSGATLADCEAQLEPGETIEHVFGYPFGDVVCLVNTASPESSAVAEKVTHRRTDELARGDRVILPGGTIRTVAEVVTSPYPAWAPPILLVRYAEGQTDEWGPGNTGAPGRIWDVQVPAITERLWS